MKGKKLIKRGVSLALGLFTALTAGSLVSCGPQEKPAGDITIDENKQQIYYYYYAGGLDNTWRINAAKAWNETNDDFQIVPWPTLSEDLEQEMAANGGQVSITDLNSQNVERYVNAELLADLTDIYKKDVDGNGVQLKDKMNDYSQWQKLASTNRYPDGFYAVPGTVAPFHLIYDHDLFLEKGWLIYQKDSNGYIRDENGNLVLTVGQDGKAGTYDDGQPVNLAEWEEMLGKIKIANNTKAFIFSTKYNFYLEPLVESLIAQYGGYEGYLSLKQGYGSYYDATGAKVEVPAERGYDLYDSPAFLKAMEFMDRYFTTSEWVHEKSVDSTGFAHKETVNTYITGFNDNVQQAAFMVEGSYFEHENKYYFDLLKQNRYEGRGYGEREYRFMLLPRLSEYDDVSFMTVLANNFMVVSKDPKNPAREAAAKDFVAFTLKDEFLQQKTISNVGVMPFDYEIEQEQMQSLTPFQRNTINMCLDKENIKILGAMEMANDARRLGLVTHDKGGYQFTAMMMDGAYERPLTALRRYTASEYVAGIKKYRKENVFGVK